MAEKISYHGQPGWKAQPWMQERVIQALSDALTGGGDVRVMAGPKGTVLDVPLGGRSTDNHSEEDLTCDKCNKVFPEGLWAFVLQVPFPLPGVFVMISGGFCSACADEEGVERKEKTSG